MARLFVAVWPPAEVLDRLEALPRVERTGVRWTTRPQWHVTLRFFGRAEPAAAVAALASLSAPRCEAVLGPRVGRLGRGVLMVPVTGLDDLVAAVRACTDGVGRPEDHPRFAGHLTLARLKGSPACGLTDTSVSARWPVDSVALVASTTLPEGSRYDTLAEYPLT